MSQVTSPGQGFCSFEPYNYILLFAVIQILIYNLINDNKGVVNMKILVATNNTHKIEELKALINIDNCELFSMKDLNKHKNYY